MTQEQLTEKNQQSQQIGLVISYFGNSVAVETVNGQVFQCHLKRNQPLPVVGDRVTFQLENENTGIVIAIEPRHSLLTRGQGHAATQPIAANVDIIVIVMAPPPIFSEYLIDRYLIAAELLKIQPIILINKMDLLDETTRLAALERLAVYQQIPYPAMLSSVVMKEGLAALATYLRNKSAVLVGPSGVGKSSIIAALTQSQMIPIGEVSAKGAGKHTTTATRLYHLPDGIGQLIDSPGVREFHLWPVNQEEIWQGFKEFQHFSNACKFRDCLHLVEPGCAVREAVAQGKISAKRYESYQLLIKKANETSSFVSSKKNEKGRKK